MSRKWVEGQLQAIIDLSSDADKAQALYHRKVAHLPFKERVAAFRAVLVEYGLLTPWQADNIVSEPPGG
jgi:hypothetical protein